MGSKRAVWAGVAVVGAALSALGVAACSGGDPFSAAPGGEDAASDSAADVTAASDAWRGDDAASVDAGSDVATDAGVDASDPMCTAAPHARAFCWGQPNAAADCESLRAECNVGDAALVGYVCTGGDCFGDYFHTDAATLCPIPVEAGTCFGPVYSSPPYGRILCCVAP